MSALIQIRNVPEDVQRTLKDRAAAQGKSLNSFMLEIVEREARSVSKAEVLARIRARGPLGEPDEKSAADYLREAREERDAHLMAAVSPGSGIDE